MATATVVLAQQDFYQEMIEEADVATAALEAGNLFAPGPGKMLAFLNSSGSTITVTIPKVQDTIMVKGYGAVTLADKEYEVGAGELAFIIPPIAGYVDQETGYAEFSLSAHEDLTNAMVAIHNLSSL